MNGFILILTVYVLYRFIDKLTKETFGKGAIDTLIHILQGKDLLDLQDQAIENGLLQPDYYKLLHKLCQITGKTPLEIFKIARDEQGFGWTDENVEKHLSIYIKSGHTELPIYVETFLDEGKNYIINA